jgi:ankyrin repeat protein
MSKKNTIREIEEAIRVDSSKKMIELFNRGASKNQYVIDDFTLLGCASIDGKFNITRTLLMLGECPNKKDKYGFTPLIYAVIGWIDLEVKMKIVKMLLMYKADPNLCCKDNRSPLSYAKGEGIDEVVNLLIKYGAKDE